MSKGSKQRASQVTRETFESNWDAIFKKKEVFIRFRCSQCHSSFVDEDTSKPCTVCGSTEFIVNE